MHDTKVCTTQVCDIRSIREMCQDYCKTSVRVSRSLDFLKHELRSLRQQDFTLLKQLVAIQDVITDIKQQHQQKIMQPATLPRTGSLSTQRYQIVKSLVYSQSMRRLPKEDFQEPVQRSASSWQQDSLVLLRSGSGSPELRYRRHQQNSQVPSHDLKLDEAEPLKKLSDSNLKRDLSPLLYVNECDRESVDMDNGYRCDTSVFKTALKNAGTLRNSTTSINTLQSERDSVYGSGFDLRSSSDSLHPVEWNSSAPLSPGHALRASISNKTVV
ncbi:uncharacterized protein LOC106069422 [Biomphalaria glabrata]|uniref:Uncharacterized protein LOC106069422 n=1 Tax=Biomphalaria glabrata TaxID=6526 RepID=A0A9U8EEL5_BIOGL|nr:uncharacterized protein LOC106069422 [Biomphalaria glabrata]